jgi:putative lipoprotein
MSSRPIARSLEHIAGLAAGCIAAMLLAACSAKDTGAPAEAGIESVAGTLRYTDLVTLSDTAVVEVELADVSVADGPADIVSSQRIRNPGPFPVHFKLDYAPDRIDPTHRYTVQARIREGERLAYATDTAYPVITGGNPKTIDIAVVAIGAGETAELVAATTAPAERPVEGTLVSGSVTSKYSASFRSGSLVSIQEERDAGDAGKSGAEYQFKEGRLLRYIELGTRTGAAGKQQVEFDFAFDDTGEMLAARKTVDDTAMKPDISDIYAARNRADLLRNHALALKASRDHAH